MDGANDGLWSTLAQIYTAIGACAVCVPAVASLPVLAGFDSFFVTLVFGTVGLGFAGVVTYVVDAQLVQVVRRFGPDPDGDLPDQVTESTRP
jgi:hypothetical protein